VTVSLLTDIAIVNGLCQALFLPHLLEVHDALPYRLALLLIVLVQLRDSVLEILLVHDPVALVHLLGFVPDQLHRDIARHAGMLERPGSRPPAVVGERGAAGRLARFDEVIPPARDPDLLPVAVKDIGEPNEPGLGAALHELLEEELDRPSPRLAVLVAVGVQPDDVLVEVDLAPCEPENLVPPPACAVEHLEDVARPIWELGVDGQIVILLEEALPRLWTLELSGLCGIDGM